MNEDLILVNVVDIAISKMKVKNPLVPGQFIDVYYEPGKNSQIIASINDKDNSTTMKGMKYPFIAMVLPVPEKRGSGFYGTVKIERIVIGTLTQSGDGNEKVLPRFKENTGNFKSILYPIYYEFLRQIAFSPNIACGDPDALIHTKFDNPGNIQLSPVSTDYIDSIEILGLEFNINQIKKCK